MSIGARRDQLVLGVDRQVEREKFAERVEAVDPDEGSAEDGGRAYEEERGWRELK